MRRGAAPPQIRLGARAITITAFVTGADHPTGLGSARALRAAGARVIGFAERPGSPTCRSRAWSEVRGLASTSAEQAADEVLAHADRAEEPVFLLPTQDAMVGAFARRCDRLPSAVRTYLPPPGVAQTLLEKTRFYAWASERGYPVPRTEVIETPERLDAALGRFSYPAILKPLVRTPEWQHVSPLRKAVFLSRPDDARNLGFALFDAAPAYVLSEWIEGEDRDVLFCLTYLDRRSEIVASFTGRKLVQWPRLTGSTAVCVGTEDPELERLTARLFRDIGCTGLASLEVKRSASDGRYLITEPTVGRPNLQSASAHCSGRNLVGIAMRHALGLDWADLEVPLRPCVWVEERALSALLWTGALQRLPYRTLLGEVTRARRVSGAYFQWGDSRPLTGLVTDWIRGH